MGLAATGFQLRLFRIRLIMLLQLGKFRHIHIWI